MNGKLIQSGMLKSKNFMVDFNRDTESALVTRTKHAENVDFVKIFSHQEVEELRELLWQIEYEKLLMKEVTE